MNWMSVRSNWCEFFKTSGELPHHLGRIDGMYLKIMKRNRKVSTRTNRLDLETLRSCPIIMPENPPWTLAGGVRQVQSGGGVRLACLISSYAYGGLTTPTVLGSILSMGPNTYNTMRVETVLAVHPVLHLGTWRTTDGSVAKAHCTGLD